MTALENKEILVGVVNRERESTVVSRTEPMTATTTDDDDDDDSESSTPPVN